MNINSATLIYFSPTGTTRKILEAIAQGVQPGSVEHLDLTPPHARRRPVAGVHADLVIIGMPVYAGRLSQEAVSRLAAIRGDGTPAVLVSVYGNRAYEDALRELHDITAESGFRTIAAGAFVGEHSYSTQAAPIAAGRPDRIDAQIAKEFGESVRAKMQSVGPGQEHMVIGVPGNFPYKERAGLAGVSPVTRQAGCSLCGQCASVCPTAAVTVRDRVVTDAALCIRCCACVKACSTGARVMEEPRILQVAEQLSLRCRARKEPEIYI